MVLSPGSGMVLYASGLARRALELAREVHSALDITVSQDGVGHFLTIGEAIQGALTGARIHVRPGIYAESLVIDKPLEIIGEGSVGEIVIESLNAACITMLAEKALVCNLTLNGLAGHLDQAAVEVPGGLLGLEGCDITSTGNGVRVYGSTANSILRRCKIHHTERRGIYFSRKSSGIVEDCEIFTNLYSGVVIDLGSHPHIQCCRIHDGHQQGILVTEEGGGTVEDCDIFGNTSPGVYISLNGNPRIRTCRIHDGQQSGILVTEEGAGLVEACDIFCNAYPGVVVERNGDPLDRICRIYHGRSNGVGFIEHALGVVEDSDIFSNAYAGIGIKQESNPEIRHCAIYSGKGGGIQVTEQGAGKIEDCDIFKNDSHGVAIRQKGHPLIRHCRIRNGKAYGVHVSEKGGGMVEECTLSFNALGSWYLQPGSWARSQGNRA